MKGELRHKAKQQLKLDSFRRDGLFKGSVPDIGDIWADQKRLRKEQIALEKTKKKQPIKPLNVALTNIKHIPKSSYLKKFLSIAASRPKASLLVAVVVLAFGLKLISGNGSSGQQKTLGDSTNASNELPDDGRIEQPPEFDTLFPIDKSPEALESVTRKSPDGSIIFTYKDSIENIDIEVTQQKLPDSFKSAPAAELEKIAKSFQATSVIQLDDQIIYHGTSEKNNVQSLVTTKDGLLIFIKASRKISDDSWVAYFTTLQ